ncbi:MAG TPA: radical SAM protein [bacterium]|nr:radical SAM protein [bacterium]
MNANQPLPSAPPEVLFFYLHQDSAVIEVDSTYPTTSYSIHCRPLLGLQYLVAAARAAGATAALWDQRLNSFSVADVASYVRGRRIAFLGFYTAYTMEQPVQDFIRRLRDAQVRVPIMVGGPGGCDYAPYLAAGADAVCLGEGESVVRQVVAATSPRDWRTIPGLACRGEHGPVLTGAPAMLADLDQLPLPARDLPQQSAYRDYYLLGMRLPYATMMASRGCPGRCTYCASPVFWGHRVRQRSPENVVAEIDLLVRTHNVRYIDMLDDVFGLTVAWTERFCAMLRQRPYRIGFKILINPTTFGSDRARMFRLLRTCGCDTVGIGMQSADPHILTVTGRARETAAELTAAVRSARQAGLLTFVSFIMGFPEEAPEAPAWTLQLLRTARPHLTDCYPLVFLPGSVLAGEMAAGTMRETYGYAARMQRAVHCKRQFYASFRVICDLLIWVCRNNPRWLLAMLPRLRFILSVMGR